MKEDNIRGVLHFFVFSNKNELSTKGAPTNMNDDRTCFLH